MIAEKSIFHDKVVRHVSKLSKGYNSIRRVFLFGSRVKGTHNPKSDYDFAIDWDESLGESWGAFALDLREQNPTLNQLDLVRLDQCSDSLKVVVNNEGILIYEKS